MGNPGDRKRRKDLKKRKREKRKRREERHGIDPATFIEKRVAALDADLSNKFPASLTAIRDLFDRYDYVDCGYALLIFELWLGNIASTIKLQLFAGVLASVTPKQQTATLLRDYAEFEAFCSALISLSPSFALMEDYVPEPDWGELKFPFEERLYKIFYGGSVERIADFLSAFRIGFGTSSADYMKHLGRDPERELREVLLFQDAILNCGLAQVTRSELKDRIEPGHTEAPSRSFWESARSVLPALHLSNHFSPELLSSLSIRAGSKQVSGTTASQFSDTAYNGTWFPFVFIEANGTYLPTNIRNTNWIFLEKWYALGSHRARFSDAQSNIRRGLQDFLRLRFEKREGYFSDLAAVPSKPPIQGIVPFDAAIYGSSKIFYVKLLETFGDAADLEEYVDVVNRARAMLMSWPAPTFGLPSTRQFMRLERADEAKPDVEILLVLPVNNTVRHFQPIPRALEARVLGLTEFLGVVDSLRSATKFDAFFQFFDDYSERLGGITGIVDALSAFVSSHGILEEGAAKFDFITLDPHGGSWQRYEVLSKRYSEFPRSVPDDLVEAWIPFEDGDIRRPRVIHRTNAPIAACYFESDLVTIFAVADFSDVTREDGRLLGLIQDCITDGFDQRKEVVARIPFLRQQRVVINLHVGRHAGEPGEYLRQRDVHLSAPSLSLEQRTSTETKLTLDVAVDLPVVGAKLTETKDAKFEVEILNELLTFVDGGWATENFAAIRLELQETASKAPRFVLHVQQPLVQFPPGIDAQAPEDRHFKAARKQIALIAKDVDVREGRYELEEAKRQLNRLRDAMLAHLDSRLSVLDGTKVLPYLLTRIEALQFEYWERITRIKLSLQHEVDYDRADRVSKYAEAFLRHHAAYRYLIEKTVVLQPSGHSRLDSELFGGLTAFADWLLVVYRASDSLHYGFEPVGLEIAHDFTLTVQYPGDRSALQESFRRLESEDELDLRGNAADVVEYDVEKDQVLPKLDATFAADAGFRFTSLLALLQILYKWPELKGVAPSAAYSASQDNLLAELKKNFLSWDDREAGPLFEFLTLSRDGLLQLIGESRLAADIPVWEHIKRRQRYVTTPLVKIGDNYHWGPCSMRKAVSVWQGNATTGRLPASYPFPKTRALVGKIKRSIEDALVVRSVEIARRYTQHAERELNLFNRFPAQDFPQELGDYDVLAYIPQSQTILSIECKDNSPPYCLKDTMRLREEIYGRDQHDDSQIQKIRRRHDYLAQHAKQAMRLLNWPIPSEGQIKVMSLYVSRRTYWWFIDPPYPVNIEFVRIDVLDSYIKKLMN